MQNPDNKDDGNSFQLQFIMWTDSLVTRYPDPDQFVIQVSIDLDQMTSEKSVRLNILCSVGAYRYSIFKFHPSIRIFKNLISIIDISSFDSSRLKMDSLKFLGISSPSLGNYEEAISYHDQALDIAKRI